MCHYYRRVVASPLVMMSNRRSFFGSLEENVQNWSPTRIKIHMHNGLETYHRWNCSTNHSSNALHSNQYFSMLRTNRTSFQWTFELRPFSWFQLMHPIMRGIVVSRIEKKDLRLKSRTISAFHRVRCVDEKCFIHLYTIFSFLSSVV